MCDPGGLRRLNRVVLIRHLRRRSRPEQARLAMLGTGLPDWLVDILLGLSSIYAAGRGAQVTDAVEQVGGAKPRTIAQFVRDHVLAFA